MHLLDSPSQSRKADGMKNKLCSDGFFSGPTGCQWTAGGWLGDWFWFWLESWQQVACCLVHDLHAADVMVCGPLAVKISSGKTRGQRSKRVCHRRHHHCCSEQACRTLSTSLSKLQTWWQWSHFHISFVTIMHAKIIIPDQHNHRYLTTNLPRLLDNCRVEHFYMKSIQSFQASVPSMHSNALLLGLITVSVVFTLQYIISNCDDSLKHI